MSIEYLMDRLFTNGMGAVADRLVLTSADGRDLGGLCREVVEDYLLSWQSRFYPGQRVRMTAHGVRQLGPRDRRSQSGTVVSTWFKYGYRYVRVLRDGHKSKGTYFFRHWEPIPPAEMGDDETARALVAAYSAGELDAALLLADRLMELHGATPNREKGQT